MEIPGVTTETVTAEELANEAQATPAPEAVKRTRTKKTDEQKAAEKAEKDAARAAKKAEKAAKEPKAKVDKFVKNLVKAVDSGLRPGTGRYLFLEASESASKVSDLVGKEFTVGGKTVKLNSGNIQGMFSRGHIALSVDGESWERVQTTIVTE